MLHLPVSGTAAAASVYHLTSSCLHLLPFHYFKMDSTSSWDTNTLGFDFNGPVSAHQFPDHPSEFASKKTSRSSKHSIKLEAQIIKSAQDSLNRHLLVTGFFGCT